MAGKKALTAHQKLGLAAFILIGVATLVFGFMRLANSISMPFYRSGEGTFRTISEVEAEREQLLKESDTDGDGITDYDEMRVFRTSPFLEDSDSDGISDGEEIARNSDPNCPEGKVCRMPSIDESGGSTPGLACPGGICGSGQEPDAAAINSAIEEHFGSIAELTPEKIVEGLQGMSSEELRDFLEKLGIPGDLLGKADDATLRAMLQETLGEVAASQ